MYIVYSKEIDSTQALAKRIFEKIKDSIILVNAETQSSGVGRFNRQWRSSVGGLYFTLILKNIKLSEPLSAYIPVTVCNFLKSKYSVDCSIKWPNDIYYGNSKLAGILIDNIIQSDKIYSFIGIGINYNNSISQSEPDKYRQVSLAEILRKPIEFSSIKESLELAGSIVENKYESSTALLAAYRPLSMVINRKVRIVNFNGAVSGAIVRDINSDGGLVLDDGSIIITAKQLDFVDSKSNV